MQFMGGFLLLLLLPPPSASAANAAGLQECSNPILFHYFAYYVNICNVFHPIFGYYQFIYFQYILLEYIHPRCLITQCQMEQVSKFIRHMFNSYIDAFLLSRRLLMTFSIRFQLYVEYFFPFHFCLLFRVIKNEKIFHVQLKPDRKSHQ